MKKLAHTIKENVLLVGLVTLFHLGVFGFHLGIAFLVADPSLTLDVGSDDSIDTIGYLLANNSLHYPGH